MGPTVLDRVLHHQHPVYHYIYYYIYYYIYHYILLLYMHYDQHALLKAVTPSVKVRVQLAKQTLP